MAIGDDVQRLLETAREVYADDPAALHDLEQVAGRLAEPLRVAIVGRVKAGKSTLLNALVGEELAPTDAGECTKIVTWYRQGHTYRVMLKPTGAPDMQIPFQRDGGAIDIDLGDRSSEDVERLVVDWPTSRLASMTLIDTPGLSAATVVHGRRTEEFLAMDDDGIGQADAVVYLLRHLHGSDVDFLEAFHDDDFANANPVNAIAVLSRADEVGACRPDALESAERVAQRYGDDAKLRQLCQRVVPVAGLLAQAAATLTEAEFQALRTLAAMEPDALADLTLTVDRFVGESMDCDVAPLEREDLLHRLGLFGVRLAVAEIAGGGATTASSLCAILRSASGVEALESTLATLFAGRRDVLKARVVLVRLDEICRARAAAGVDQLVSELERVGANAHEFSETRLLSAVRSRGLALTAEETDELERLLAPSPDAPALEQLTILEAIGRWTAKAESPFSTRDESLAARTIVRSYEGAYAALG